MKLKILLITICSFGTFQLPLNLLLTNKNYEYKFINENLRVGEEVSYSSNDFKVNGRNFGRDYRVYIDSSNDKWMPYIPNSIDYIIGKSSKDEWREHLISGITINTLNYSSNKSSFY